MVIRLHITKQATAVLSIAKVQVTRDLHFHTNVTTTHTSLSSTTLKLKIVTSLSSHCINKRSPNKSQRLYGCNPTVMIPVTGHWLLEDTDVQLYLKHEVPLFCVYGHNKCKILWATNDVMGVQLRDCITFSIACFTQSNGKH
jgi:hypothetical protein